MSPERGLFLSTLPARRGEHRLALAVVLTSVVIFLVAMPFAKVPLGQLWAFIPIYQSAFVVNDLITAVLLFGQFSILGSRALWVLATGYLFTATMAVAHMLTFPGLFASAGLLDGHQLQQVVVNLLANAHHAMRETSPPRRLGVATRHDAERRRISIAVADGGPGISPAAPIVRGKTILVVDDEPDVAAVLMEALAVDGHHVDTAPNGAEALVKIAGGDYDLIISDCGMPVLGGVEFYGELSRREPRLAGRLIFVTGDTLNQRAVEFLERIDAPQLSKPFSLDNVQSLVRQVMQRLYG